MKKVIILLLLFLVVVFGIYFYRPIKFSVKIDELPNKTYILVEPCATTLANWKIIGNQDEKFKTPLYVRLEGNGPAGFNYDFEAGKNTFICYGVFKEDGELEGEVFKVFEVTDWDILYPVKRNSLFSFCLPKSFICGADMI